MTRDIDRYYDGLMEGDERDAFEARLRDDAQLGADLEFRSVLDDRLRAAFPMAKAGDGDVAPAYVPPPRNRSVWWLAVAALLLVVFGAPFLFGPTRPDLQADVVWAKYKPGIVTSCNAVGPQAPELFRQHVRSRFGCELDFDFTKPALVDTPLWTGDPMLGSAMNVVFRDAKGGADPRLVLIGAQAGFRTAKGVRVFERTVRGVRVVELVEGKVAARTLPLFK